LLIVIENALVFRIFFKSCISNSTVTIQHHHRVFILIRLKVFWNFTNILVITLCATCSSKWNEFPFLLPQFYSITRSLLYHLNHLTNRICVNQLFLGRLNNRNQSCLLRLGNRDRSMSVYF
jgi:hypothetical protein